MDIDYELAKKLKEAGFDQDIVKAYSKSSVYVRNVSDNLWYPGDKQPLLKLKDHGRSKPFKWGFMSLEKRWDWENYIYIPTLSELIEACGEDFEALVKQAGGWGAITSLEDYMTDKQVCTGDTPEIAVAELWLSLNKK